MIDFHNKTVWITGASSGIGEASAYRFAQAGASLILTARQADRLGQVADRCKALGSPRAAVLPFDLAQLDRLDGLAAQAWDSFGPIDLFFCNAGISQRGTTLDTDLSVIRRVVDLDFYAPVVLTKALLPRMIAQGGGQLAVTTSIAGRFGFPMRCAYSSAKHALYGFFETLQAEYHKDNIHVTLVCPGRVQTNISLHALESDGREHGQMDPGQAGGITAAKAAEKIFRAISRRRLEVLVGGKELLMVHIKRFFPTLCATLARNIKAT
jgi:short-subunit dehydrogenase